MKIREGWYRTRTGRRVFAHRNNEGWFDKLPWIVATEHTTHGYTCDDEGYVFPPSIAPHTLLPLFPEDKQESTYDLVEECR